MVLPQVIFIASRLFFGAVAAFFAIIVWAKTRDLCWMLMAAGTIALYAETVYNVLIVFGIVEASPASPVSIILSVALTNLPFLFYIAAFITIAARKFRRK